MIQSALILAFVYYIVYLLDCSMAWDATWRPLFVASLTGLALGDMKTGLIMGASLEAIYMGISAIGGVIPSDPCSASILSVAFVVLTGADLNLALALAVPIGTVMQYVSTLISPIDISLVGLFEKFAREGKDKSYTLLYYASMFIIRPLPKTMVVFLAAALGVENLQTVTNLLPAFVMNGLSVSGGMLVAVGFAILTSMIWSKALGIYFFLGFAFVKFLNLPIIGVSIFALAAAILNYTRQWQAKKMKDEILAQLPENHAGKEDLFG